MKEIIQELFKKKTPLVLIALTVIINVAGTLALPAYLAVMINEAIPNQDALKIIQIGGVMLVFVAVSFLSLLATGYLSSKTSSELGKTLRSQVFKKVQYFSAAEFDRFSISSLITRTNNDVIQVQSLINMVLRVSLMAPIMAVGGIVLALAKSVSMSMVLLFSVPLISVLILWIARKATPLSKAMQEKIDRLNLVTREKLTGLRVQRAFGTEEHEEDRFREVNQDFTDNSIKMNQIMGLMTPLLYLILYVTTILLLALGGWQITQGTALPVGDIIAVIQYVMQIMLSVMLLAMVFVMVPRASVSAARIQEILHTEATIQDGPGAQEGKEKGTVVFDHVSFRFPDADSDVIQDISFESKPGEMTAIIGSTGSGKSSLINLIPRFYDVSQGKVLVNGQDVRDYKLEELREKIGYVLQKAFLFKGTIAENIRFGDREASEDRVEEAAVLAQSLDFIRQKENSFLSEIAQGGTNVSGGQRQRLAIARAVVRKPDIYIFDDSFSALDFKTDAALRQALAKETKEATVIVVAQRISTIQHADQILVLEGGKCVGQGKHDDLLKNCDVYREIVESQFSEKEAADGSGKETRI